LPAGLNGSPYFYAQLKPDFDSGSERTRLPVAEKRCLCPDLRKPTVQAKQFAGR